MKFSLRNLKVRRGERPSRSGKRHILQYITLLSRLLQFCSSVIVIAFASYFIRDFHQSGEHIYYQEIVATSSAGFFLVPLILTFWNRMTWHVLPLDLIYSYLWLTAFIFAAEDYEWQSCSTGPPSTLSSCTKKWVLEAFIFLSFVFTFLDVCLQLGIWVHDLRNCDGAANTLEQKSIARQSVETDNSITNGANAEPHV